MKPRHRLIRFVTPIMAIILLGAAAILPATPLSAMQIFIEIDDGHFAYEVEPTDTILSVKEQIEAKENIAVARQTLIFAGKTLANENTLQDYSIQKDSTLHLVVAPEPDPEPDPGPDPTPEPTPDPAPEPISPDQPSTIVPPNTGARI
jgi:outer membrane biosynthesis protein TonB